MRTGNTSVKRLVLTYLLVMLSAYGAVHLKLFKENNSSELLSRLLTVQTTKVLNIVRLNAACDGTQITLAPPADKQNTINFFAMDIKFGCNGIEAMLIYAAAVAAFPASWKRKSLGIAAGILLIHIANVSRIVALAFIGIYHRNLFQYFHVYVLQGMMVAFALVIFFVYLHLNAAKTS